MGMRRRTPRERAERRAAERELMSRAVDQLRSTEGWQRWLRVRRHFHKYSFRNQLLIAFQMPEATVVAGRKRWREIGYEVRDSETRKGIDIWAPCRPSKKALRKWRAEGTDPNTKPKTFFRMVQVFDRSQVDPIPDFPGGSVSLMPPPVRPVEGDALAPLLEPLIAVAASIGIEVEIGETPPGTYGYYLTSAHKIGIEAVSSTYSPNMQVTTLVHEEAHALLDVERKAGDPDLDRDEEEVVVECVAHTVLATMGYDISGHSVPYVTQFAKGDEIERYAKLIDRVASRIEGGLLAGREGDEDEEAATRSAAA